MVVVTRQLVVRRFTTQIVLAIQWLRLRTIYLGCQYGILVQWEAIDASKTVLEERTSETRERPFAGRTGGHAAELEGEINQWLTDHPNIKVVDAKQSASGGSFNESLWLIAIWYDEKS